MPLKHYMRVALYTRVSTDEQASSGYSLEDQLDKLESHARQHGWEIVARITDDGYSATDPTRPGLLAILRLAEEGKIDAALATKRDRFYRSRLLRLATDQDLEDHGVQLLALDDTGHMMGDSMLDTFAEWERENTRDRLMDGKFKKARKGEIPGGGHAPYGFSWTPNENGKQAGLVPNDNMEIVRTIFDMVARGESLHTIAHALSAVPTPRGGRRWHPNTIARIVRNESYKGVYYYGKHRTVRTPGRKNRRRDNPLPRDEWVAVPVMDSGIPHELIDAARGKLDARYRPRPKAQSFFELGGVLVCPECGCKITGYSGGFDSKGKAYRYYVCNARKRDKSLCPHGASWNADKLERRVALRVESLLQDPDAVRLKLDHAIQEVSATDPTPWLRKVEECDRRRAAYQDQQADGLMSLEELRSKLDALAKEREFAVSRLRDSSERNERAQALRATKDSLLGIYKDGILYDGLLWFDATIRREIYEALQLTGTLSAEDVELRTEVTEYALKLTKAAQEWAEGQDDGGTIFVGSRQHSDTSTGTTATVRTTIATITSTSE
jgi:site-specific DNA recombinase